VILLLLLAQGAPSYPLPNPERDLTEVAEPVRLTDLVWGASETTSTTQEIAFRARLGSFGFLAGQVDGELRGVSFETQRLFAEYTENQGSHSLDLSWRARRLLTRLGLDRRPRGLGGGAVLDAELALRLDVDLELLAGYQEDTDPRNDVPLAGRVVRGGRLGALWQRGTILELSGELARERLRTSGFLDEERTRVSLDGVISPRVAQLRAVLGMEDVGGRLSRRQWIVETANALRLAPRLVLSQGSRTRFEPGIGAFENRVAGGFTLFARRHSFARSGEAARRMRALAERGFALGLNERRAPSDDARRAFRERLALSPWRAELREDLLALHAAQVVERNVPVLAASLSRGFNDLNGTSDWRFGVSLGVPWRPGAPWRGREDVTDFARVEYEATRTRFKPDLVATDHSVNLRVFLNRELELFFGWTRPGVTPADIIRLQSSGRRLDVSASYLFGQ
jgi:hypothetical protein